MDTDTISYFLRKNATVLEKVEKYVEAHGDIAISVVTYYEVLNGLLAKDAKKQMAQFEAFLALVTVFPVTMFGATSLQIFVRNCAEKDT